MLKRFTLILLLLAPLILFSQEKPTYKKTMYVNPEGKLYVNKDLGLYLWLSTSADENSKKFRLKSEETSRYSNPMYFDTDGYNTFRSPSAVDTVSRKTVYPIHDIVFEVYADAASPVTKTDFGDSKPFLADGKTYVKSNTKLNLIATDKVSGVESTYYSLDGAAYTKYEQPLTFTEEREYKIKYYSVDNVGNCEDDHVVTIVYDNTPPKTTHNVTVDEYNNIISARSKIELTAEDSGIGLSKIKFKIDDGNEYTYQNPLRASQLSQGEHTVTYYSVDKVGNTENTQTYNFYIDKSAPTIIEEVIAKTFFANGREFASGKSQLKLTAFDNKAGIKEIKYSINGGDYEVYEKPVFLTSSSGNLDIKTYAVDNVNNKSQSQTASSKTSMPYIDLAGPSLQHSISGPVFEARDTTFISSKTSIVLKSYDKEAGINRIEYRIDGKENKVYSKPFTIEEEGVHTITYVGYDNVENTSSKTFFIKVDNTGPKLDYTFSTSTLKIDATNPTYPKYVILFFSGTDNVVGLDHIRYGFGENTTATYSAPVQGFSVGPKKLIVEGFDKLGNKSTKTISFDIQD